MRVRLTRKLAERIDGVDLSSYAEGDVLTVSRREAELLVAEGWASRMGRPEVRGHSSAAPLSVAADMSAGANGDRLQHMRRALEQGRFEPHAYRRREDRLRDELHDAEARVINGPQRKGRM